MMVVMHAWGTLLHFDIFGGIDHDMGRAGLFTSLQDLAHWDRT